MPLTSTAPDGVQHCASMPGIVPHRGPWFAGPGAPPPPGGRQGRGPPARSFMMSSSSLSIPFSAKYCSAIGGCEHRGCAARMIEPSGRRDGILWDCSKHRTHRLHLLRSIAWGQWKRAGTASPLEIRPKGGRGRSQRLLWNRDYAGQSGTQGWGSKMCIVGNPPPLPPKTGTVNVCGNTLSSHMMVLETEMANRDQSSIDEKYLE